MSNWINCAFRRLTLCPPPGLCAISSPPFHSSPMPRTLPFRLCNFAERKYRLKPSVSLVATVMTSNSVKWKKNKKHVIGHGMTAIKTTWVKACKIMTFKIVSAHWGSIFCEFLGADLSACDFTNFLQKKPLFLR